MSTLGIERNIVKGLKVFEQVIGIVYILQAGNSFRSLDWGNTNCNGEEGRQAVLRKVLHGGCNETIPKG